MPDFRDKVRVEGVTCLRSTDKALLVEVEGREIWIPQSQVDDDSEVYEEGQTGTLIVSDWIADEKGLT